MKTCWSPPDDKGVPSKNPQEPTLMMLQSGLVGWSAGLSVQEDNFMKFNSTYDLWPELKTVN